MFNQLANSILKKIDSVTIKEDNEIMVQMKSGKSFGDFLRSLVGKSRKDILDSGSFARLYSMNMHGIGGNKNSPEAPAVLLSRFLSKFGDYVNQDITKLRSGAAETDEFKNKYDYEGHLEREKERRDLFRQSMTEDDPEKKAELRQKKNAFRNNSEYAEARRALYKKEDADVHEYHNRPIEQGEIVNDGSDEFKELENLYNKINSMRGSSIEDQEGKLNVSLADAEKGLTRLAATADDVMVGPIGKLMNRSARQAKKALKARSKVYLQAIPAYNKATKDMADAYAALSKPQK
tara:strand:+ start:9013 stop:9888 length:876 start_codon:yes stop_codon:yes gene_type:complete